MASCRKGNLQTVNRSLNNEYKIQAANLYKLGNQYLSTGNDSLNLIGNQLIRLGKIHGDTLVIVNGELLKANYEWRSSNYMAAMAIRSLAIYRNGLRIAESNPAYERSRVAYYDDLSQYYKLAGDYERGLRYGNKGVAPAKKYHQKI